jgi:uncharacterized protein (DUF433 family)
MRKHPEEDIIVKDDYNHGQPSLPSGYTVLQVIQLLEGEFDNKSAADRLNVPIEEIRAASAYYRRHRDEIEEWREEKMAVADEYRPSYI